MMVYGVGAAGPRLYEWMKEENLNGTSTLRLRRF